MCYKRRTGPVDEPEAAATAPDLALAGASADAPLRALFEDFFVARKPLKGSPHTEAAYRSGPGPAVNIGSVGLPRCAL
jgi:hypothetical protein